MRHPTVVFLLLCMAALITLWCGCATVTPYHGPAYSTPIVRVEEWTHWNTSREPRTPFWEKHRFIVFENPTKKDVHFDVDCEWNHFRVDVPPVSVNRLMITPEDGSCDIKRVPSP